MQEKKQIDWERIEVDYRAGIKTLRDIGAEHDISHVSINKRAKRDGWVRDLTAKIQAKAAELVTRSLVTKSVTKGKRILESEVITANAVNNATIEIKQREDVTFGRGVITSLMQELKGQIDNRADLEDLGEMMRNPDAYGNDKLNDQYMRVVSFAGRVDSAKKLADANKVQVELERRVYKIDTDTTQGGVEDFLKKFRNV
jgi:hypothetical protein